MAEAIAARLAAPVDDVDLRSLAALYEARGYRPLWSRDSGSELRAEVFELRASLDDAASHGLDPGAYAIAGIEALLADDSPAARAELDLLLSATLTRYVTDLRTGRSHPLAAGFALLAVFPVFAVLATLNVLRRSIGFGLTKPTTDMLYSVVSDDERYKAKNFIETAVYRGADVVTAYIVRFLNGLIGIAGVAAICVPLAALGAAIAAWIGRQYQRRFAAMGTARDA